MSAALAADPRQHAAVLHDFIDGSAFALHAASVILLIAGALVTAQVTWSRHRPMTRTPTPIPTRGPDGVDQST